MNDGKPAAKGLPEGAHERLLVEAAQQDPKKFSVLYEQNFDRVYAYVLRRVRDRDAAEELAQETFVRAYRSLKSLREETKLSTWRSLRANAADC